jgi:hypothetical protein
MTFSLPIGDLAIESAKDSRNHADLDGMCLVTHSHVEVANSSDTVVVVFIANANAVQGRCWASA